MRLGIAVLCAVCLSAAPGLAIASSVVPVPLVPGVPTSTHYRVYADGIPVPVGVETSAGRTMAIAQFEHDGPVDLRVVVAPGFTECVVRPERFGLAPTGKDAGDASIQRELRLAVDQPRKLVLELASLPPLVLVGSRPLADLPDEDDPNVIYFPPGVHEPGRLRLRSNQTVYLAPGAEVYGTIEATCVENVRVTGRGRLYGSKHTTWGDRIYGLIFDRCRDVTVEGIGIRDCKWWVTEFLLCDGVRIRDINMFTFNRNNGGLMIDGCARLTAVDSLLMCRDDCICPHALNAAGNGEVVSADMLFEDLVLYNVHDGNAIRIGASFETSEVRDWRFRRIDVVHRAGAAVYADHSDWAVVKNLVFEDFHDEIVRGNSIDMRIEKTGYACQTGYRDERGRFEGLYFIDYHSRQSPFLLRGHDPQHGFDDVVFAGCTIGGAPLESLEDIKVNEHVSNVRFLANRTSPPPVSSGDGPTRAEPRLASPARLVIDDGDKQFRSYGFATDTAQADSHRGDHSLGRVKVAFGSYAAAIYKPGIRGEYEVSAYVGNHPDADTNAPWIVRHRGGYTRAYVDQRRNPGWRRLGVFELDQDSDIRLVYPNYFEPTRSPVIADAVRFTRRDAGPDRTRTDR